MYSVSQPVETDRSSLLRIGFIASIGLALLVTAFFLAERRPGQDWGGDFALYISHARNLSEGRPYASTGYIVDPYFRSLSPATYPPLFPLVLAPLFARYGLDYQILKIPGILFFAGTIPVFFCLARRRLPVVRALVITVLWAAWPFALSFKDLILPDFLYLLLWMLTIWVVERAYENPAESGTAGAALLAGILMFGAYATRSAGIVAPVAVIAYDCVRFRKISRFGLISVGTFGVLFVGQNVLIHNESSYLQMFTLDFVKTAGIYQYALSTVLTTESAGWIRVVRLVATAGMTLFAVLGFALHFRRFRSPAETILAAYLLLLLLWSSGAGNRYFMPLVPFLFIYMALGLQELRDLAFRHMAFSAEWALAALILICYGAEYAKFQPGPIPGGISTSGFADLCQYIEDHTNRDDVFIYENPRVLSLYTGRSAAVYPESGDPQLMWDFSRSVHARYLVATNFLAADEQVTSRFLQQFGSGLRLTYSNANFRLYAFAE
ncbi:MAG TPA: glycosyltransferase family 39 protein [Bryobacteraceae bacterium]|nr:glycosyltransferase family 39 protein [Bryobacteraceae bacterium]